MSRCARPPPLGANDPKRGGSRRPTAAPPTHGEHGGPERTDVKTSPPRARAAEDKTDRPNGRDATAANHTHRAQAEARVTSQRAAEVDKMTAEKIEQDTPGPALTTPTRKDEANPPRNTLSDQAIRATAAENPKGREGLREAAHRAVEHDGCLWQGRLLLLAAYRRRVPGPSVSTRTWNPCAQ